MSISLFISTQKDIAPARHCRQIIVSLHSLRVSSLFYWFFALVNCCLFIWVPDTNRQPQRQP